MVDSIDSEDEIAISWNPTEMIPKLKIGARFTFLIKPIGDAKQFTPQKHNNIVKQRKWHERDLPSEYNNLILKY
jgi:hypothetical protein